MIGIWAKGDRSETVAELRDVMSGSSVAKDPASIAKVPALVDSDDAPVLLITADKLAKAWVPYAIWKTKNGKLTKIVTTEEIDKKFIADSLQEKIRLCVRQHIDNHNTRWLVLGGDCLPDGGGLVPGGTPLYIAKSQKGFQLILST